MATVTTTVTEVEEQRGRTQPHSSPPQRPCRSLQGQGGIKGRAHLQSNWQCPDEWLSGGSFEPPPPQTTIGGLEIEYEDISPVNTVQTRQTWRYPHVNTFRLLAVSLALFNLGVHDAALGPLIPSLEAYYGLSYTLVSLVFLATFPGYLLAAMSSDYLHQRVGQRGIAAFASSLRVAAYVTLSCHPPWGVVVALLALCGWGNGLLDAGWNIWVAGLAQPNELLGIVHGCFGLGAAIAPIIASAMVNKFDLHWFQFYYVVVCLAVAEWVAGTAAFWNATGEVFRMESSTLERGMEGQRESGRTRRSLKEKTTWMIATFFLVYAGVEVSISGWVVTFMQRVRHGQPFPAAMTSTGFWLGITVGRLVLGFVTARIGERWAIAGYLVLAMGLELIFWLVPTFMVSAVAVSLLGFFLGPMFPAAVVVLQKLLPKRLQVGAISFTAAVGMGGGAVMPFAVGAIASSRGVGVLQPIILALVAVLVIVWLSLPRLPRHSHSE